MVKSVSEENFRVLAVLEPNPDYVYSDINQIVLHFISRRWR
jgi:hypothetical protein